MSEPSTSEPLAVRCIGCEGKGCGECDDGLVEFTSCPMSIVTADTISALRAGDLAKLGVWPVAGGWLDQSNTAIEVAQFVAAESDRCEAATRSKD